MNARTLPRLLLVAAAFVIVFAVARPSLASPEFSNSQTSLTLIFQNNLNSSDDVNHVSTIMLDQMSATDAIAACRALNEQLVPQEVLENYSKDFVDSLDYLNWKYGSGCSYTADGGVVSVENGTVKFSNMATSGASLPVLCTQSDRSMQPQNSSATVTNLVSVRAAGNTYTGYRNAKSFRFNGIRYADEPNRFEHSNVYSGTEESINATVYGSQCLQGSEGSEDCLFLNIQTPYVPKTGSTDHLRPVFFWIHGGGFTGGTGSDPGTDGSNMASREDIVTVTINYRLSTLGFLAIPDSDITGNYGIGDQITALQWVAANIASFGGDPKRITIAGSSAGAGSVRTLLGSLPAIPLFQGAMADSNLGGGVDLGLDGNYGTTYSDYLTIADSYNRTFPALLNATSCLATANLSAAAQATCLRSANATQLITGNDVARYVVQDGHIVNTPSLPLTGRNANTAYVPIMFGVAANDGASFSVLPTEPVSNLSQGLQLGLSISDSAAQSIIDSNLFPFYDTRNLTLDAFNVTQRVATDNTFRCIDQATVYAGATTGTFPSVYYYQFERARAGYNPNNLDDELTNGPVSEAYPYGDPTSPDYFRLHGATGAWISGNWNQEMMPLRDDGDLWSVQLVSGYVAEFVKSGAPNPSQEYLTVRGAGYEKVLEAVRETGQWEAVNGQGLIGDMAAGGGSDVRFLDWPARSGGFVDVEQCSWLNYSLGYYLQ